jgi:hypothetical protein
MTIVRTPLRPDRPRRNVDRWLRADHERWARVIKSANIRID